MERRIYQDTPVDPIDIEIVFVEALREVCSLSFKEAGISLNKMLNIGDNDLDYVETVVGSAVIAVLAVCGAIAPSNTQKCHTLLCDPVGVLIFILLMFPESTGLTVFAVLIYLLRT